MIAWPSTGYAGSPWPPAACPHHCPQQLGDLRHQLALPDSHRSQRHTTSYAYDSLGNCTTITEADGTHQQLVWSPRSNLMGGTDATAHGHHVYDWCDRVIHRDLAARGPAVATTTF